MAVPGTGFTGEWHERTFLENEELAHALGWRSVLDTRAMLEAANQHAGMQLELHARYAEATGLNGLQETVQGLNRELLSAQASPRTCLVCLGWGSGFLSKTGFLQTERESYRKILRSLPGFAKAIREGVPFPKTRRIVFAGGHPSTVPGWVKLQVQQ
jgi:CRISPR-associated protein Csm5